jgi:predicted hotdog family 3-hydroxylacyl-ACP dehydratase
MFNDMNVNEYNILDLIPQRPPMVMIERLTYADDHTAKGTMFIRDSNLFCDNGFFREPGLVEFIAQTAAAFTGYQHKSKNIAVSEGYIGAVKNLVIHSLPPMHSEIQSEIVVENEIVGFTIIIGKVYLNNQVIAECEMRILGR